MTKDARSGPGMTKGLARNVRLFPVFHFLVRYVAPLANVKLLGRNIFDLLDGLCSNWLLPLGGLIFTLFVGWWMSKPDVRDELTNGGPCNVRIFNAVYFLMRYLAPIGILVVFLSNLFL